jgi:hypothetical protein
MTLQQLEQESKSYELANLKYCTVDDLIQNYGRKAEQHLFCLECAEWKTCRGSKWSTCHYRKWYIKEEIKNYDPLKEIRHSKNWTKGEEDLLVELYNKGKKILELTRILGRERQAIMRKISQMRNEGVEIKFKFKRINWTEILPKAIELRKGGMQYKDIGAVLGVRGAAIQYQFGKLKKQGVLNYGR